MKTTKLLFVLLFLSGNLFAQIKVSSNGQVEINSGTSNTEAKIILNSTNVAFSRDNSVLTLCNTSANRNNWANMNFSSKSTDGQVVPFVTLSTKFTNKDPSLLSSSFYIGTYNQGVYANRFGIYGTSNGVNDVRLHFAIGHSGSTELNGGFWVNSNGNGEVTLQPNGGGWGYIGAPGGGHWRKLYVSYANYNYHATISSDRRIKKDISDINGILNKISQVKGVKYGINNNMIKCTESLSKEYGLEEDVQKEISPMNEELLSLSEKRKKEIEKENKIHFGFIAQDLMKVFPEVVEYDEKYDTYGIQYTALIPVLFEGIKEQQIIMEQQVSELKDLREELREIKEIVYSQFNMKNEEKLKSGSSKIIESAYLFQNTPNPFTSSTEIKYFIPEKIINAVINIYNSQGALLKSFTLENNGNGSIVIGGSELPPGIFIYTLVVDGREVDSKKMILAD